MAAIKLSKYELEMLVRAAVAPNVLQGAFGPGRFTLEPTEENNWAMAFVAKLRREAWCVAKWPEGFIVVDADDGLASPDAPFFAAFSEAREACDQQVGSYRSWNARGLSDAPHMDAY